MIQSFVAALVKSKQCSSFALITDNAYSSSMSLATMSTALPRKVSKDRWSPSSLDGGDDNTIEDLLCCSVSQNQQISSSSADPSSKRNMSFLTGDDEDETQEDENKAQNNEDSLDLQSLGNVMPTREAIPETSELNESASCLDLVDFLVADEEDNDDCQADDDTIPTILDQSSSTLYTPAIEKAALTDMERLRLLASIPAADLFRGPRDGTSNAITNAFLSATTIQQQLKANRRVSSSSLESSTTSVFSLSSSSSSLCTIGTYGSASSYPSKRSAGGRPPRGEYRMLKSWGKEVPPPPPPPSANSPEEIESKFFMDSCPNGVGEAPPLLPRRRGSGDVGPSRRGRRQHRKRTSSSSDVSA